MRLTSKQETEGHWISVADLMAGLMMIFLFIAISYMIQVKKTAKTYTEIQSKIYQALYQEFNNDLKQWGAVINQKDLSITFKEPEILFEKGKYEINQKFRTILHDFFPRYINILKIDEFKNEISEIRIEGHTSSEGLRGQTEDEAYFYNMNLSQNRTKSVLQYVLLLDKIKPEKTWIKQVLTANGLSSSKTIKNKHDVEDRILSRRVEFRVKTNAEKRILKISQATQ